MRDLEDDDLLRRLIGALDRQTVDGDESVILRV